MPWKAEISEPGLLRCLGRRNKKEITEDIANINLSWQDDGVRPARQRLFTEKSAACAAPPRRRGGAPVSLPGRRKWRRQEPPGGRSELSLCPVISYAKKSVVGLGAAFAFCARKSFSACGLLSRQGALHNRLFGRKSWADVSFFSEAPSFPVRMVTRGKRDEKASLRAAPSGAES